MKLQWSIQPRHTQLALDHVIYLNYRSMHLWPPIRLDNITWNFTFDSINRSSWSFWHNYISLWEWHLIFHLDGIAFGFLKNHTLYFWSLSLFLSRILVRATGFCSSISLYIWRFTFGELFLAKDIKSGKIYRHKSMHVSRLTKPFINHLWQVWRSIYNSHIDFKISSTVIIVQRNKLRS